MRAEYPLLLRTVGRLQLAGGRVPGFSLHDELETLVQSGLTAIGALRTATRNAARVMDFSNDYGSVEPGRIADLVLPNADPTRDIASTRRIAAVVHGQILDKSALDRLLAKGREMAATN